MYWRRHPNFDAVRHMGRWSSERTARLYIQDGLARLAEMSFEVSEEPFKKFYALFLYLRQNTSLRNSGERG